MAGIWTRNYYNMLTAACLGDANSSGGDYPGTPTDYSNPLRVHDIYGNYFNLYSYYDPNYLYDSYGANIKSMLLIGKLQAKLIQNNLDGLEARFFGIGFGSGSSDPSFEDYTLSFVSGLTLASATGERITSSTVYDTDKYKSARRYTVTNGTSSTYTINEMGLFLPVAYIYNSSKICALAYREKFDETIYLAPGESFLIEFKREGEIYHYTPYPT